MTHKPTERVLNILSLLASQTKGLPLTQISLLLQIPKSTISPILQEMTDKKFLYLQEADNTYAIGISSYCIGAAYERDTALFPYLKEEMKKISDEINEICQVGVLTGPDVLYILKQDPAISSAIKIISYVGKKLPAYCTALGKALLCEHSYEELKNLYPEGITPQTPKTVTDLQALHQQLQTIRQTNIATEYEEISSQLCCFAVPIRVDNHKAYAMSVSMPLFRTSDEKIAQTKKLLLQAKTKIENLANRPITTY